MIKNIISFTSFYTYDDVVESDIILYAYKYINLSIYFSRSYHE